MFSFRWHPSRLVRAWVALGLAIIGAVLVWAALPRPSTPDPTLATAPNGHGTPSTSATVPEASADRPTPRAVRATFGIGSRGWFCRNLTQSPCLYRSLASDRGWSTLGWKGTERWRCQKILPTLDGSQEGPHQVHSGRPSSLDT
jgi:hypothetical protein